MDDQLVQVPWELLHDGRQFLCQGFNLGRLVKTRQNISGGKTRLLGPPLKVLVLADPGGRASITLRAPNGSTNFGVRATVDEAAAADLQVAVSDKGFG